MVDNYEVETLELQWVNGIGNWYSDLKESLKYFIRKEGSLNKDESEQLLSNLIETQDSLIELTKYSKSYTDDMIKNMKEALKLLIECAKFKSPLKGIIERTIWRLKRYLTSIDQYGEGYYYPKKYPSPKYYYEEKSNQDKLYKEKIRRLESIIRDTCSELSAKAKEELSRKREVKPQPKKKTPHELALEKEKILYSKLSEVANYMILQHFKRKYRG